MEFLKSLFEKGALTWEQFQQAAKDAKFEVVNAAGGAYVPKADLDTKAQELTTANNTIKDLRDAAKAWDGKDPKKLEDDLKNLQTKYDTDTANIRRDAAIDLALTRAHARDPQLTRAALSMDDIKIGTDGKVTGLDAQLEMLKKDKAWLFEEDGAGQSGKQGDKGGNPNGGQGGGAVLRHKNAVHHVVQGLNQHTDHNGNGNLGNQLSHFHRTQHFGTFLCFHSLLSFIRIVGEKSQGSMLTAND